MATVRVHTYQDWSWVEVDTDANNRVVTVRGRNTSCACDRPNRASKRYAGTFGDTPQTVTVPTTTAGRIQLTVDARGRLDGLDCNFEPVQG